MPGGPVVMILGSNAESTSLIPGQGTQIPHALQFGKKKKNSMILKDKIYEMESKILSLRDSQC